MKSLDLIGHSVNPSDSLIIPYLGSKGLCRHTLTKVGVVVCPITSASVDEKGHHNEGYVTRWGIESPYKYNCH